VQEVVEAVKNDTNILKYRRLAPVYDVVLGIKMVRAARSRAFCVLDPKPDSSILVLGIGTGEDLEHIPKSSRVVGVDISEDMLMICRSKISGGTHIRLVKGNVEDLKSDEKFDYVVMNLILSVAENPKAVLREGLRALKDDGRILIFDKFRRGTRLGVIRRLLNVFTKWIGTDINRRFEEIIDGEPVTVEKREDSMFDGRYQIVVLKKKI
jgi:phosphatidylethanolamine/phosphatidyl-N-methylethanolamine N-methyltransferase